MNSYFLNRRTFIVSAILIFSIFSFTKIYAQETWENYEQNGISIKYTNADKTDIAKLADYISSGNQTIKKFFGKKFPKNFEVYVFPDRKSLTEAWRKDWNVPDLETECWMLASGTASKLTILSPRAWRTEACEHNPDDIKDTQFVITHEMVHVFHGQSNPNPNFDGMDSLGWFVEGLAVYASGQLDGAKLASPREAIEKGKAPTELEKAWSGKYRYGISGSIVKFIDEKFGRKTLLKMLKGTNEEGLLGILNLTEDDLLSRWRNFILISPK